MCKMHGITMVQYVYKMHDITIVSVQNTWYYYDTCLISMILPWYINKMHGISMAHVQKH